MKRTRWGKKYVDRRNWRKYNKKLVKISFLQCNDIL